MPSVTFRSPAATMVAVSGAVRVPTVTRRKADMRVPVVRAPHAALADRMSSPVRTGRGPPAQSLHTQNDRQGEAIQASALFVFPVHFPLKGQSMSVDHRRTIDQSWLADMRASLADDFATQTARLRELTELNADTGDPGEAHNQAALLAATRQTIEQITGALSRISDGTYGACQRCHRSIPAERLEILPHARFCVPCQEKQNR
ncbi:TraR/DksA C4-type zinc finger protein [Micromonospora sp. DH14]|uniref:TraR/DksA family transcriptional regulator n=1 Tax=Micromonospora sp. DH14 TaxID=3040120 RepID=UPI0024412D9E|nr:TraR/DksA C4-type zinc finger protein [Micromonospora sp. DH14]MDG9673928.1 TraR/DksA C4-type zinc finger protein [Micromonospora sp. DH14]